MIFESAESNRPALPLFKLTGGCLGEYEDLFLQGQGQTSAAPQ